MSASRTTFPMSTSRCLTVWCLKTSESGGPQHFNPTPFRAVKWLLKRLLGQLSDVGTREDDMTVSWVGKSPAQDTGWYDGHQTTRYTNCLILKQVRVLSVRSNTERWNTSTMRTLLCAHRMKVTGYICNVLRMDEPIGFHIKHLSWFP